MKLKDIEIGEIYLAYLQGKKKYSAIVKITDIRANEADYPYPIDAIIISMNDDHTELGYEVGEETIYGEKEIIKKLS